MAEYGLTMDSVSGVGERLLRRPFDGYKDRRARPTGTDVMVLTPRSIVGMLGAGYVRIWALTNKGKQGADGCSSGF